MPFLAILIGKGRERGGGGFREKMTKRDIGGREGGRGRKGKKCHFLSEVLFE